MPFGRRTTPPSGGVVLEQMLGHFQGGGSTEDFVINRDPLARAPLRDDRSPAERAADHAYISLLLRIDDPEAHAQVQAESNRRDAAGQEEFKLRHAKANREAAQRGCSDGLDPFLVIGRSI